jgi:Protein of unknown function (DUF3306)
MDTPSPRLIVTILSLLAAGAGAATAHESLIRQPVVLARDPASQLEQATLADRSNPPLRGASDAATAGFDAATSPPIESIDAKTNITVFLQNGVPDELRLAALRRAWTVDPAIRDFKGPQENDWNFNNPDSMPGFGQLGPEVDVKRMAAEVLGEAPRLVIAAEATGRAK